VRRPAPPARCSPAPDNPVTWPIRPGNEPIAANLPPERGATRKVYNWTESIYKKVVKDFEKQYAKYDVKVQISTYGTMDDVLGKLVQSDLPRPLNHADIPNISQVWPVFQNPFYRDRLAGRQGRRRHRQAAQPLRGAVGRALPRQGRHPRRLPRGHRHDPAEERRHRPQHRQPHHLDLARDQLVDLARRVRPRVNTNEYIDLPEGKTWITQAWSGDMSTPSPPCRRARAPTSCATGSRPTTRARSTAT
jgi:hypothetical protein